MIKVISTVLLMLLASNIPSDEIFGMKAPDTFKAKFTTTKGEFVIEAYRNWSPEGVDRLYQLIKGNYYDSVGVYRYVKGFVAQFGFNKDPQVSTFWKDSTINDEPVVGSNVRGTMSFARAGVKTRADQMFINLEDNKNLDTYNAGGVVGYPPIAKVIEGMDVVDDFYSRYGQSPNQGRIASEGVKYLVDNFPKLDYILKAEIIENPQE
jgi:cyclophilin family peptidyl-prolyl cis-trans isomerase